MAITTAPRSAVNLPQRTTIWAGAIISIAVPADAEVGRFPSSTPGEGKYVWFSQCVRGGGVNIFVHSPDPMQFRGRRIVAQAAVIEKSLPDGRSFLHVNLRPLDGARPTHRFAVVSDLSRVPAGEGFEVFETPEPLEGAIVFAPLGAKFL